MLKEYLSLSIQPYSARLYFINVSKEVSAECHVIGNLLDNTTCCEIVVKVQLTFWAQNIDAGEKWSSVTHTICFIESKENYVLGP